MLRLLEAATARVSLIDGVKLARLVFRRSAKDGRREQIESGVDGISGRDDVDSNGGGADERMDSEQMQSMRRSQD